MDLLLVDGSAIFRMGMRAALSNSVGEISVVGECGTGQEAEALTDALHPDVVLTELNLPDRNGIALSREVKRRRPSVRVLLMTTRGPEPIVHHAVAAGASGYLLKKQPPEEIVAAVRAAMQGEIVLPPGIGRPSPERSARGATAPLPGMEKLSHRQRQTFDLIVCGSSTKEIADRLSIGAKTVESHRTAINRKLGVRTSADLVRLACFWGMIG